MFARSSARRSTVVVPLAAALLVVGCAREDASEPTAAPAPAATTAPQVSATPPAPPSASPSASPVPASPAPVEPVLPQPCSDDDLTVTGGQVESDGTSRSVDVSFTNASAQMCTLVGYPGADLVGGAGGVLVHVARRPANAAPRLELLPGEVATADVHTSAVDTTTGDPCGRIGTLVVTPPNNVQPRLLEVNLPICDASIGSVG
jgi:Protein of unknown function (DUF4232)